MENLKELVNDCLSRYESGESVSRIAEALDTDEYDIHLIMTKDRFRYDYADTVRARRQAEQLQKIKKTADRIALKHIEKIEKTIQSADTHEEKIRRDIKDIRNAISFMQQCLDSLDQDRHEDRDDNQLPFEMVVRKHYAPSQPEEKAVENIGVVGMNKTIQCSDYKDV